MVCVSDLYRTPMSLISFHRFLIATAIIFCFGYAIWELMTWWAGGEIGALTLGGTFIALGGFLTYYLARLRRFLGVDPGLPGSQASPTP
jgi:drug/metabolite transporter (DMT)-like permease